MRSFLKGLASLAVPALLLAPVGAMAQDAVDSGMTIYMQMGEIRVIPPPLLVNSAQGLPPKC